jgi:hypothetical protein
MVEFRLPSTVAFDDMRNFSVAEIPWTRHYGQYQSGGWWTCTLIGQSSDPRDGCVTDTSHPQRTEVLRKLPAIDHLLRAMGLRYMIVRLAKLDPGGALWEHRDYQDLTRASRHRIHVPLVTNPDAYLVCDGGRFHMSLGSAWTFRPISAHAACNAGTKARVHLILDVYDDNAYEALSASGWYCKPRPLPVITTAELHKRVAGLQAKRRQDPQNNGTATDLEPWEEAVLRMYFEIAAPEGELYLALASACRDGGDQRRAAFWTARRELVLGSGVDA